MRIRDTQQEIYLTHVNLIFSIRAAQNKSDMIYYCKMFYNMLQIFQFH